MSIPCPLSPAHWSPRLPHGSKIIAQCESKIKAFEGVHATINRTRFADHLKNIGKTCTWGTNLEIIVTATLFGVDIYVATDNYRPGKPTWLKYSPNLQATTELHKSNISDLSSTIPTLPPQKRRQWLELAFQDATSMLSSQSAEFSCVDRFSSLLTRARLFMLNLDSDLPYMLDTRTCTHLLTCNAV